MLSSENSEKRKQWLNKKPVRITDWIEEEGQVRLKVIKFKSKFGIWLCKLIKKPNYFFVNLDEIGSFIWKKCDGKNKVGEILEELKEKYGGEKMEERLYIFLKMLERAGYIKYE